MKKYCFIIACAALVLTSCKTLVTKTSAIQPITTRVISAPVEADLDVSENKITYTYTHLNGGGEENAKSCAVSEALKQNGDADVLVAPQYTVRKDGKKVKSVIVSGYPAKYKNFKQVCYKGSAQKCENGCKAEVECNVAPNQTKQVKYPRLFKKGRK